LNKQYKCNFNKLKFDAVICLKGNIPNSDFFDKFTDIPLYAADGAADLLFDNGVIPDFIIGDLDSYSFRNDLNLSGKSKIINEPDQETNDFEKILLFTIGQNLANLLIIGFHGGDLEHTLNNWSVYKKFADKLNLCIYDNGRYGIPLFCTTSITTEQNEIVSLIPQPACIISTHNLKWILKKELLELGIREGARNVSLGQEIKIEIHEGSLLCFINHRLPFAPEFKLITE